MFISILSFGFSCQEVRAAANLTVSSATLDSNGKTLTLNISNVSGALSPATGITGFTVNSSGYAWKILTATSSGSVVTLVTDARIGSNAVVTISLATSPTSNLTDTGSNTPAAGQTSISVTNNSSALQATLGADDSKVVFVGTKDHGATFGGYYERTGAGGEFSFSFIGTDCSVSIFNGATVSIDGGAYTSITNVGSFARVSIASGLSDTLHNATVKAYTYVLQSETLQCVGSNPSFSINPNYAYFYPLRGTNALNNIRIDGAFGYDESVGYATLHSTFWGNSISFKGSPTAIRMYGFFQSARFDVYRDDTKIVSDVTVSGPTGDVWGLVTLATGLDGTSHVYKITPSSVSSSSGIGYFYALAIVGSSIDTSYTPTYSSLVTAIGDSNTQNTVSGSGISGSYVAQVASALNIDYVNAGVGGATLINDVDSVYKISSILRRPPQTLFINIDVNDTGTANQIQTAATDLVSKLWNGVTSGSDTLPGLKTTTGTTKIVWFETHVYQAEPKRTQYSDAIRAAIASLTPPTNASPILYITTRDATWPSTTDLHFTSVEQTQIANGLIPYASSTGYLIIGPSSGTAGQASTNFTAILASGATFTGAQSITISDGSNGGTITPSVGSSGVSSTTVTPTNGVTNFTFTYTPASSGTKTLTFTNGQSWTDVSSTTYIATTVPVAAVTTATLSPYPLRGGYSTPSPYLSAQPITTAVSIPASTFSRNLEVGFTGSDVKALQQYLNSHGFILASTGPGSPGNETTYFGALTKQALAKFQKTNNIYPPVGFFGPITRAFVNKK